jgi:signal transduction histidine kinase
MSSTTTVPRLGAAEPSAAALDVAIAAAAFAGTVLLIRHGGIAPSRPGPALDLIGVVLVACSTVPLIAWRRFPLGVFAVTASASVLMAGLGYPVDLIPGPTAAVYLLAASRERQTPWTRRTTATVVGLFVAYVAAAGAAHDGFPGIPLLHGSMAWAVAWFAGERTRLRREQLIELHERAARAEREVERERLLAVAEERARIARDLHDSAGHAISLITVRAGAARLRHDQDPDRSLPALQAIEELARHTAEEIDQIVGTLRAGDPAAGVVDAPPGLSSLSTLIARHRAAGLHVTLDTRGVPRPLSGSANQATYRILQEALSNAGRHGTGGARINLAYADTAVELTITNPVHAGATPRSGGGHGLIGMRERATLLGGDLDTEHGNGTFSVYARIPYGGHRT